MSEEAKTPSIMVGEIEIYNNGNCFEIRIPGAEIVISGHNTLDQVIQEIPQWCYGLLPQAKAEQVLSTTYYWMGRHLANKHLMGEFVLKLKELM